MPSRRHVLQSGLALSAAAVLPARAAASAPAPMRFSRFVFSNRFAESTLLARRAAERGAVLWETSGDMTGLWCDHLKAAWDAGAVPLAGVTTRDGLFVLETLAADYRMRVVYRGEHGPPREGRVIHRLMGPQAAIAAAQQDARRPWGLAVAEMMTRPLPDDCVSAEVGFETPFEGAGARTAPLYSWIIAAPKRLTSA